MGSNIRTKLTDSFLAASNGFSPDRVVADPELNARFIAECRAGKLTDSALELNHGLLNLRKQGLLAGLRPSKRTIIRNLSDYKFAAEIAVRFLERRDGVTLDAIICDPGLAAEFDRFASEITPGFSPLEYRWAALYLRKQKRLGPELLARIAPPIKVIQVAVPDLQLDTLPVGQGLYVFFDSTATLYVGEASNLRVRLKKHLDHSDNKGLAVWLWEFGPDDLHLEIQVLEPSTSTRVRKALEMELIRSRNAVFNVRR